LHNGLQQKIHANHYVLIYSHLSGADEVAGESWQLLTAICDEGDGLMLFVSNFFTWL
jgi:hypothetical protein